MYRNVNKKEAGLQTKTEVRQLKKRIWLLMLLATLALASVAFTRFRFTPDDTKADAHSPTGCCVRP